MRMKKSLKDKYMKKFSKKIPMKFLMVDLNETFDEDKVLIYALPFDEDIQASVPPAHQEENMMSCNPLEDLDDTLSHDLESK